MKVILHTAHMGEWPGEVCPQCRCSKLRGHKCSCPVKRAYKLLGRVLGEPVPPSLDDDDLIVEHAMRELGNAIAADEPGRMRAIVRDAVDEAMHLGARK